ncbi:MAG: hypothetical protein K0R29_3011 [Pseudobdellovibrio sp.]|jgi:hypothetical protein|nr:hypothetical protein [Pseudobdellovibrio sp.]
MKKLVLLLSVFVSTQVFAATVELGKYLAVPKEFPTVKADLDLKADNSATVRIDAEGEIINCTGTFAVAGNDLNAHANCDHAAAPEINVSIDITNVTPEGLRSEEGVEVPVKFDLLGDEAVQFILKKND